MVKSLKTHCEDLKIPDLVHRPVRYLDESHEGFPPVQIGVVDSADEVVQKRISDMFFTKLPDWSSEREYRYVLLGVESTCGDGRDDHLVDYGDALRAVILGAEFPNWSEPCVRDLLRSANVKLLKAGWDNGRPSLVDHSNERAPLDFEQ